MVVEPHWTAYFQALLTPIVAVFAGYVAVEQWTTARNKLRYDLFEKRFAIYEGARHFIGSIAGSGKVSHEDMFKYLSATNAANWIVGPEVKNYLERELYKPAVELQCLHAELEGMLLGEARTKNIKRQTEITIHLNAQFEQMDRWFNSYLQLAH